MPDSLTVIFSLIGVIAFILAMFWAARWFQKKYGHTFSSSGKNLRIEESVSVSPDTRLIVASIDGRRFLIGAGNARLISELSETVKPDTAETAENNTAETENSAFNASTTPKKSGRMPISEAFKIVLADKLGMGTKVTDNTDADTADRFDTNPENVSHGDNEDVGKES